MDDKNNLDLKKLDKLDIDEVLQVLNSWDFQPPVKEEIQEESKSYVRFSKDGMEASLFLAPPKEKEIYTQEVIHSFLETKGVKAGIIKSTVRAMIKKKVYNRETLIARGIKAVPGKNGYYQFFFSRNEKPTPQIRRDGTVDYSSFNVLQSVSKDDVLAIYHPATNGTAGCDVRGKFLPLQPGKDMQKLKGKGFYKFEGSNTYYASMDGKVEYKDNELTICSIHVIEGDITSITGKIEFYGDIVINGNIEAGASIRTGKTLTVNGNVEACQMFAGGDIILKKGIQGAQKSKIIAKGNLYADFIEQTEVEVQGDVKANVIMNSVIHAEGKVYLTGKRGTIIGGYVHALEAIEANSVGNDVEVHTIIHVGYNTDAMDNRKALKNNEKTLKEDLSNLMRQMGQLEKYKNTNSDKSMIEQEIRTLQLQKNDLIIKLGKLKEDSLKLQNILDKAKGAYIRIDGSVYRGVVIGVDENQFSVFKNTSFMRYANVDGKLTPTVIIE